MEKYSVISAHLSIRLYKCSTSQMRKLCLLRKRMEALNEQFKVRNAQIVSRLHCLLPLAAWHLLPKFPSDIKVTPASVEHFYNKFHIERIRKK